MENIYHFSQKSTTCQVRLHQMQQVFGDFGNLKLKKPKHVRWLSHRMAVDTVWHCLPSLIAALEQEATIEPIAAGFAKAVTTYEFVASTYLMSDILTSLGKLSLTFQKTSMDLALVQPRMQTTIYFLNSLKSNDGQVIKQLSKALNEDLTVYNLHADKQKEEKFKREVNHI